MSETLTAAPPRSYLELLRHREYLGLLVSQLVSLLGDQLSRVALTLLVFERTGSPLLSSATYAATFLPVVVGGPLLGGLADRMPRRRLLVLADLLRAGLFALMAVPGLSIWVLLSLLLVAVTIEAPWYAARTPLMRDILVDDDGYQLGTSLDETLHQSGQLAGFAAAGALLVVFTPTAALLLDACSFVLSATLVRLLVHHHEAADPEPREPTGAPRGTGGRWSQRAQTALADARIGCAAALAPACRRPLLLTWAGVSFAIVPEALAAPWGHQLGVGPLGIGLLFAAAPAGSVLGLLVVGRVSAERGQHLLLPLAPLSVVPLMGAAAAPTLSLALFLVLVAGVGLSYSMLARVAFVRGVEHAERGRAFAVATAGVTTVQGVGIALAGVAASLSSPATAITLAGVAGVALIGVALAASPPPSAEDAEPETAAEGSSTSADRALSARGEGALSQN